jgi:CxxC motif-containing protein (DUF1111 family)
MKKGTLSFASVTLGVGFAALVLVLQIQIASTASGVATDPGVRSGAAGAGAALAGLTPNEHSYFNVGLEDFEEAEDVPDGLGPRMNLDSCAGCHIQPAVGGSSPATNPQIAFASKLGGTDRVPPFLSLNGPVREARFVRNADGTPDGGVHALFTVNGRQGAGACNLSLPDWGSQMANRNVVFRIPTPTFGAGLMEMIPDSAILGNQRANSGAKAALGIRGRANFFVSGRTISGQTNNNGNDGTIARFGWKAQNKSLLIFSGEAYNVEMGITNDLFMTERDENPACDYANNPNSITDPDAPSPIDAINSIEKFTFFMRFLAPPTPSATLPGGSTSINTGKSVFNAVGCVQCHTASFTTGKSAVAALRYKPVPLYSDLLVHDMGVGLADGVSQGSASGREFRTAPLWGLGQRIFFLHDGRSADLISAIKAHASSGSEATGSVMLYNALSEARKQDLLNFLRSL